MLASRPRPSATRRPALPGTAAAVAVTIDAAYCRFSAGDVVEADSVGFGVCQRSWAVKGLVLSRVPRLRLSRCMPCCIVLAVRDRFVWW